MAKTSIEDASRKINVLLDRFLEISNYYHGELKRHMVAVKGESTRLELLIESLESTDFESRAQISVLDSNEAQGQNIVPTADTLRAMGSYRDDILSRLEKPENEVPRNIAALKRWLKRDVLEITSSFPSFTLAWDKLVELSRITLVPDPKLLKVRDNIFMVIMEFQKYIDSLFDVIRGIQNSPKRRLKNTKATIEVLRASFESSIEPSFQLKLSRVYYLLETRGNSIEESIHDQSLRQILDDTLADTDTLAIVGLQLGFYQWLNISEGVVHRKNVIKSLIYFSKILLAEGSWHRADEFASFAIELAMEANRRCDLPDDEGTAMFRCNRFWARFKLGRDIASDLEDWNMQNLHPRYTFLKYVLLRKFEDAVRVLEELLPQKNKSLAGNLSMYEVEEWPILEDFRQSEQFEKLKKKIKSQ